MADFSALKAAIQTAIKTNGNEEITGSVLQNILLSIVTTMGDGAINGLTSTLNTEMTNRQNADAALQNADIALGERISSETTSRQEADTTLQTFIGTINTKLSEGYV